MYMCLAGAHRRAGQLRDLLMAVTLNGVQHENRARGGRRSADRHSSGHLSIGRIIRRRQAIQHFLAGWLDQAEMSPVELETAQRHVDGDAH